MPVYYNQYQIYCHYLTNWSTPEGTARDVSLLIDYLPACIFPKSEYNISTHLALGVSLGGHATWSCLFHEPRISTGIVIIGCPDFVNLIADRARLSKRSSWTISDPPGSQFLGSEDFPLSLLETVRKYDPAALLLSHTEIPAQDGAVKEGTLPDPSEQDKERLRPLLTRSLARKRILNISGGADKLVPYHRSEPILTWLKKAIAPGGWFADGGVYFEDLIFEKAGHQLTPPMMDEVIRFVAESLSAPDDVSANVGIVREAKI
jgi:pimeloyl-ACP methyl ester carboxylesterase